MKLISILVPAILASIVVGAPAQAAVVRPGGVLVVSDFVTSSALDARTGATLAQVGNGRHADVSTRGRLAYARDVDECYPDTEGCWGAPDLIVTRPGGVGETVIVHNPEHGGGVSSPDWSPDGRRLLFNWNTPGEKGLMLVNADGTGFEQIVPFTSPGKFSPDGRSVAFVKDGNVQVIDLATRVIRPVTTDGLAGSSRPDWSPDGRSIVYVGPIGPGRGEDNFHIVPAAGGTGTSPEWDALLRFAEQPAFSPDGRWVAFTAYQNEPYVSKIWVARTDGTELTAVADSHAWVGDWF